MDLDPSLLARWIEPLARGHGEIAEIFVERRREAALLWVDGEVTETRMRSERGLSARWADGRDQRLVFVSRADAAGAREALRELQSALGREPLPIKRGPESEPGGAAPLPLERWRRRLASVLARHAPRHRMRWTWREIVRDVVPAHTPASSETRRLLSLEGTFTAASKRGDETRSFSFHSPDAEPTADELKTALAAAAMPREAPLPCGEGETDAVLADGCAAVLFHEILSHALEVPGVSPLTGLSEARLGESDLDVRDDPTRLDLFGGYEWDDEGTRSRPVKLLDAGRLSGRLTARRPGDATPSNGHARRASASDLPLVRGSNVVVTPGQATREEMTRRLGSGLWIEAFESGSVDLAGGTFRLRFPRARRVRRGRFADEVGPGILAGEILPAFKSIEGGLGRQAHPYRALGWCARGGQIIPVQGAAPDLLIRRISVRAAP